ncbi:MarR family transcriptional regulator [Kitasatospora sp. NPDC001527]|uniref:MarR family transcriptional regulator n=1 Tax=Kitasatospora sp. NPDC001527 TaxID=3154519 RepID=UPI003319417D
MDGLGVGATDLCALPASRAPGRASPPARRPDGPTARPIDRLERAGYVRRPPPPEDRRKVIVEPVGCLTRATTACRRAAESLRGGVSG